MKKSEKVKFIRDLSKSVVDDLLDQVGKMPDEWDGHELRQLLADKFSAQTSGLLTGARLRHFRNDVLVRNI